MSLSPQVSIGLPVYNGDPFLREALDSLLAQTFGDFEIVVSDNGSTDATPQICAEYAQRDPRVKVHRYEENRGPAWNHNNVWQLATGRYFKWAANDDLCDPTLLEKCVAVLDADETVVLAFPQAKAIDESGEIIGDAGVNTLRTDAATPAARFTALANVDFKKHACLECFGVMRLDAVRDTGGFVYIARGDTLFLIKLLLRGRFVQLPEVLFFNRDHRNRSVQAAENTRKKGTTPMTRLLGSGPIPPAEWWNPSMKGRIGFPEWRLWAEYFAAIGDAPLSLGQKLACYARFVPFSLRWSPRLVRDIVLATEQLILRAGSGRNDSKDHRIVTA